MPERGPGVPVLISPRGICHEARYDASVGRVVAVGLCGARAPVESAWTRANMRAANVTCRTCRRLRAR